MKTLLIIDMQKSFYGKKSADSMDGTAQDKDVEDGVVPGKPGFDLLDCLRPESGYFHIIE